MIESRTGVVRLQNKLDREKADQIMILIYAVDLSVENPKTGSLSIEIKLIDYNDNPPVCKENFIAKTLVPPVSRGDVIANLSCDDFDTGPNGRLSYTLINGNTNFDFAVSAKGEILLTNQLSSPIYHLEIVVSDNGTPSLETSVFVMIEAGGTPVINNLPSKVFVKEDLIVGTSFFTVKGYTVSKQIHYHLEMLETGDKKTSFSSTFKINTLNGHIYTIKQLDRENIANYTLYVTVTDIISNFETSETLIIEVLDVNDNHPKFEKYLYRFSAVENIPEEQLLLELTATDLDINENSRLSYSILSGNEAEIFHIDDFGQLVLKSVLDREVFESFTLVVIATDNGKPIQLSGSATIMVSVLDTDEYDPEFLNMDNSTEISVSEDTPIGAKIVTLTAQDLDVHKDITYYLDNISKKHFFIDPEEGDIYLTSLLDREKEGYHFIIISAEGHAKVVSSTVTLTVTDVNDHYPRFRDAYMKSDVSITSLIGSIISNISVTDNDSGDNGKLKVEITAGNIANTFDLIALNKNVYSLILAKTLNADSSTQYSLQVVGHDFGKPQLTSTMSLFVEVRPEHREPKFTIDFEVIHVPENTHLGKAIYKAEAITNLDNTNEILDITYHIVEGNGEAVFSINKNSGLVYVATGLREKSESFTLLLEAKNIFDQGLQDEMTLKIQIDDINDHIPLFTRDVYTFQIREDAFVGTKIGTVLAKDGDKDQNAFISYALVSGEDADNFQLDPFSGVISLQTSLNVAFLPKYEFRVMATDHGTPALTSSASIVINLIDVNNNAPKFQERSRRIRVMENIIVDKIIYKLNAFDEDIEHNGKIEYRIVKGNSEGKFSIDIETGAIKVVQTLDREETNLYQLVFEANDKGNPSQTGTFTLTVDIGDVNDNKPSFSETTYYAIVNRFTKEGTFINTFLATDVDSDRNGEVEYQIIPGKYSEMFQVDQVFGHLMTFSDIEQLPNQIELSIIAMDFGTPRMSSNVSISLDLFPPLQTHSEHIVFNITEYAVPKSFVGSLNDSTSLSLYTIMSGNYNQSFFVTADTGSIYVNNWLDRETYKEYFLIVRAISKSNYRAWKDIHVHIAVSDENDNDPAFDKLLYTWSALENSPVGYKLGCVKVTDADTGINSKLSLYISDTNDNITDYVGIDLNGTLHVRSKFSFEFVKYINLTVYAIDNGQLPRTASCNILITVVDVEECPNNDLLSRPPGMINFEIPIYASTGFEIGCLDKSMFGLTEHSSDVRYMTRFDSQFVIIDGITGCAIFSDDLRLWNKDTIIEWVVISAPSSTGSFSLLRVDAFVPEHNVVVFTHAVSKEVLESQRFEESIH